MVILTVLIDFAQKNLDTDTSMAAMSSKPSAQDRFQMHLWYGAAMTQIQQAP